MAIQIRTAFLLLGYERFAESIGVDVSSALARVGLTASSLSNPEAWNDFQAVINLLEYTATVGNCPSLGLRLSQLHGINSLGATGVLIQHAKNVGEVIRLSSRYTYFQSPALRTYVKPVAGRDNVIDLTFAIDMPHLLPRAQTVELWLGSSLQGLSVIGDGKIQPLLVQFPHPRQGSRADYRNIIGCAYQFDAPVAAIRILKSDLQRPIAGHNPVLQVMAETFMQQQFVELNRTFADQVRIVVCQFLGLGKASHEIVARELGLHPRTMQRRLRIENQTFENIVDRLRREQFIEFLHLTKPMSLSQIASALGYSEHAALTRACRRWYGRTPTELRREYQSYPSGNFP